MKLPKSPPSFESLVADSQGDISVSPSRFAELIRGDIGKDREPEYLHWDKMVFKPPPAGINNHNEWWLITKTRRASAYRKLHFKSTADSRFVYWLPDPLQEMLHRVDQHASGNVEISAEVINRSSRDRYLVSSLIEEAITSSQLEGASTTQRVAKAMLREGRSPRDESERMISNNYRAMEFIREVTNEALTKELLLELHKIVTENTLGDSLAEGRFRLQNDNVAVVDHRDNTLLHSPPNTDELDERIRMLCDFANSKNQGGEFIHPVVQSIILHFIIGYDHPFVDGNGRTARALFYWSMARHGYWMMEYISISTILKNAPSKYARAYLYTETDDNDVTYFLDFNLRVILRAIKKLQKYLQKKTAEIQSVNSILDSSQFSKRLNYRQLALLAHALRNPGQIYSIESHRNSHNISYPTSRLDLLELTGFGLLSQRKIGKAFVFQTAPEISERLKNLVASVV